MVTDTRRRIWEAASVTATIARELWQMGDDKGSEEATRVSAKLCTVAKLLASSELHRVGELIAAGDDLIAQIKEW